MDICNKPSLLWLDICGGILVGADDHHYCWYVLWNNFLKLYLVDYCTLILNHIYRIWTQSKDSTWETYWWFLCPVWNLHFDPSYSNCSQQLCCLLQESTMEEWGWTQEKGKDYATCCRIKTGSEISSDTGNIFIKVSFL